MKILLNVKPYLEVGESNCGPASLKILLSYYNLQKSEQDLAKLCKTTKELGTSADGIKRAAKKLGFKVKIKANSSFKDIELWLKKGIPVIVDWFTRGGQDCSESDVPDGHYSVAIGLDDTFIYLQDPEIGKIRKITRENFMIVWFDFEGKYIKPNELVIRETIAIHK